MLSDQPSFDWKLALWTGSALVSPFHSRSSMILPKALSNSVRDGVNLTHIKTVSRAIATDMIGVFPTWGCSSFSFTKASKVRWGMTPGMTFDTTQ